MEEPRFYIKNTELKELDRSILTLNDYFLDYLGNIEDKLLSYPTIKGALVFVKAHLDEVELYDRCDKLVAEHIRHSLESQIAVSEFLANPNQNKDISDVLSTIFGNGSVGAIENIILDFDIESYKEMHENREEHQKNIDSLKEVGDIKGEPTEVIKNGLLRYGREHGIISEDFDFQISIKGDRSGWDPLEKKFILTPTSFRPIEIESEIIRSLASPYLGGVHEVLGHGVHQANSDGMPHSVSYEGSVVNFVSAVHKEGIASERDFSAILYFAEHASAYGLSKEDLIFCGSFNQFAEVLDPIRSYFSLLKQGFIKNPKEGVAKKLEEINVYYQKMHCPAGLSVLPVNGLRIITIIQELSRVFARRYIENLKEQFNNFPKKDVEKALTTGVWSYKLLPNFVEYYLNRYSKKLNGVT